MPAILALPSPVAQKRWRGGGVRGMILKYEGPPVRRALRSHPVCSRGRTKVGAATRRTFICSQAPKFNLVSLLSGPPSFGGLLRGLPGSEFGIIGRW